MTNIKQKSRYYTIMDLENVSGLIRYLYEKQEAIATELKDNVMPSYNHLKNNLDELELAGLIIKEEKRFQD